MVQLSKREEEILLTIWGLKEDAYLVEIRKQICKVAGKDLTIGAIHIPLAKLEKAGIITSKFGEATAKRGGRRKPADDDGPARRVLRGDRILLPGASRQPTWGLERLVGIHKLRNARTGNPLRAGRLWGHSNSDRRGDSW